MTRTRYLAVGLLACHSAKAPSPSSATNSDYDDFEHDPPAHEEKFGEAPISMQLPALLTFGRR